MVRLMLEECWVSGRFCLFSFFKDVNIWSTYILTKMIWTQGTGYRHSREGISGGQKFLEGDVTPSSYTGRINWLVIKRGRLPPFL